MDSEESEVEEKVGEEEEEEREEEGGERDGGGRDLDKKTFDKVRAIGIFTRYMYPLSIGISLLYNRDMLSCIAPPTLTFYLFAVVYPCTCVEYSARLS